MSLVENERTKLTATYLNGAAIAILAVGGFAPIVSYPFSGDGRPLWAIGTVSLICVLISLALHSLGRRLLGELKE